MFVCGEGWKADIVRWPPGKVLCAGCATSSVFLLSDPFSGDALGFYGVFDTSVHLFPGHKRNPDDSRWSWQYQERVPVLLSNFFHLDEFILSDTSGPPTAPSSIEALLIIWESLIFFAQFSAPSTLVEVTLSFSMIYCPRLLTRHPSPCFYLRVNAITKGCRGNWNGQGLFQVSYKVRREQKKIWWP